jgi:ubiquinone/menaquinone biosynthesis C-methylase UbiE
MGTIKPSQRFNQNAARYAQSRVHTRSPTIRRLHALLTLPQSAVLCDVACGPGHLGLSFAKRASRIIGVDPAPNMLSAFRQLAQQQPADVELLTAHAEALPLPSDTMDATVSRLAAHHFDDVQQAIHEMARVTKPGQRVGVIDLVGHSDPVIDAFNHTLEMLHDPTHRRSYTAAQWQSLFTNAGLIVETLEPDCRESAKGITVHQWCEFADSGEQATSDIRRLLREAPRDTLRALHITHDGRDFRIPIRTVLIVGKIST